MLTTERAGDGSITRDGKVYIPAETTNPGWELGEWDLTGQKIGELVGEKAPAPEPDLVVEEPSEKEKLTKVIEDAKLSVAKRNGYLIGQKATTAGLKRVMNPYVYSQVYAKVQRGEIADLGKYPHPV